LCRRLSSIVETSAPMVRPRFAAISRMAFQKASSRLTLVLWPANNTPLFTMRDFFFGRFMCRPNGAAAYVAHDDPPFHSYVAFGWSARRSARAQADHRGKVALLASSSRQHFEPGERRVKRASVLNSTEGTSPFSSC
jgi:hypothetical protein